jgi:PAS domain S-box-containing protein
MALRASEARYRALVHATSQAVWRLTPDGERQLSLEGSIVCGHTESEVQPGDWLRMVHPEDRARTLESWRRAVATQSLYEIEHRAVAADGSYRHLLARGVPVCDAAGEVLEWIGASADITERKQAEVALREREAQLAVAQRVGRVGVWGRDLASQTSFVTQEWCEIIGVRDPAVVRSLPEFLALVHPADRPRVEAANRQAIDIGSDVDLELRILHPERGERWMLARARRLLSPDGKDPRLLGVIIDLTEQKQAEEQLRLSEERLRFAAQAAGFGSYDLDLVTGQAYRSPEYKALFGLRPEEEVQLDVDQLPICLHPDDRALVRKAVLESRDPQGSGIKDLEYRVILPNGRVRWLLARGRTFFEGEGRARRPVRSLGIALDVTERKQLEQEILEISGREQRRIGHDLHDDLCQRLGGLQLLSGVLEKELDAQGSPQAPQAGRILTQVRETLERARLLARGLAPVALDCGGLVTALQELADDAAKRFHLPCDFHGEVVLAIVDPDAATQLYRIAQEAITNAVKHGRAKRITICLVEAGDQCELKVKDNGRGFARTKATTAGMGLRIMKYRATMIGASLEVRSAAGRGTTVTCVFSKHLCGARDFKTQRRRPRRVGAAS